MSIKSANGQTVLKMRTWGDLNPDNFTDVLSGSLLKGRSQMASAKSLGFLTPSPLSAFWTNL